MVPFVVKTEENELEMSPRLRFVSQTELPPINPLFPIPVDRVQPTEEQPQPRTVDVSAVAFPATDNSTPSHFACGRNSGLLSLHRISPLEDASAENAVDVGYLLAECARFQSGLNDIAISGDGTRIGIPLEDGSLRLLDTNTFREIDSLQVKLGSASTCAAFAPQSNLLVVGTYAGTLHAYDPRMPRPLVRTFSPGHGCPVSSVAFHPDGTALLSAGLDGLARVWDATGPLLATLIGSADRGLGSGVFSPNGRYALLGALDDGALGLWDLADSGRLKRVRKYPRKNTEYWLRAVFTDTGLIVGGSEDGKLMAWDSTSTKVVAEMDCAATGVRVPLACATSKSYVVYGGLGTSEPRLVKLSN